MIRAGVIDLETGLGFASNAGNLRLELADFAESLRNPIVGRRDPFPHRLKAFVRGAPEVPNTSLSPCSTKRPLSFPEVVLCKSKRRANSSGN